MYTLGHEEILEDAMSRLAGSGSGSSSSDDDPIVFFGDERDHDVMTILMSSISYPDFPCGSVKVVKGHLVDKLMPCSAFKLASSIVFGHKDTLGYQSHNGFYALWHSMTIDPNRTVANVAKNVVEYVMVCCKLAFERQSMFWLGFALHIIMDSYSPAHVLREGAHPRIHQGDLVTWVRSFDTDLSDDARSNLENVRALMRSVIDDASAGRSASAIVGKHRGTTKKAAAFILFDHLQRQELLGIMKAAHKTSDMTATHQENRTILNFYYYPLQKGFFHSSFDFMSEVKKAGLYENCVEDVLAILHLFRTSMQGCTQDGRGQDTMVERRMTFLLAVQNLLSNRTFKIHPECSDSETGFDITDVLYPSHASLEFNKNSRGRGNRSEFTSSPNHSAITQTIKMIGSSNGVFMIPMQKKLKADAEIEHKTFRFTASPPSSSLRSHAEEDTLIYNFIRTGTGTHLGYPVSVKWKGVLYRHPVLLKK